MKFKLWNSQHRRPSTSIRWDRLGLVALILVGCSSGVAALVGSTEGEVYVQQSLSHPTPLASMSKRQPQPVFLKQNKTSKEERRAKNEGKAVEQSQNQVDLKGPMERDESLQPCSVCKGTINIARNPYTAHQQAARALPNSFFVKNNSELRGGKRSGKLVDIEDGRGYRIEKLTHSHAVLLPETYELLKAMGNDFADALEGTESEGDVFRVTSVTRTEKQQQKLRRKNPSATKDTSTHSYGASFDIAFVDRLDGEATCSRPTREMERMLNRYQDDGYILVIPERGCLHITLKRPLPDS